MRDEAPSGGRGRGRVVAAAIAAGVLIGGVSAAMFLGYRHSLVAGAAGPASAMSTGASPAVANGVTSLQLVAGDCVAASALPGDDYAPHDKAACGTASSDLVLAKTSADAGGCPDHEYLRIQAGADVYCFTLDVKPGDCLDSSYLKAPCGSAQHQVIKVEAGPGGANSCRDAAGATHWVPVGPEPVSVGCIGPVKGS